MSIGENIEKYAKAQGLNIKQLALMSEVNYQTLYAIIKRKSDNVSQNTLKKVAAALGVRIADLTCFQERKTKLTEAELTLMSTIDSIVGMRDSEEREDALYFINSILEENANLINTIMKKLEDKKRDV